MVSWWPFSKSTTTASASFEKTLSNLTERISKTTAQKDGLASSKRRWNVLWSLFTTFTFVVYLLIAVLVVGRDKWGINEYATMAGGPAVIFAVRQGIIFGFDLRINGKQRTLDDLFEQRKAAIDKFKRDTQYDSTQKLLEKYGAERPKAAARQPSDKKGGHKGGPQQAPPRQQPQRTGLAPPPTANIQRPQAGPAPPPQKPLPAIPTNSQPQLQQMPRGDATAEFAPNAFGSSQVVERQWYDRLMDVLLGDDETKPGSRLALVCANPQCRLVNGQAPPGTKTLAEVGRWRCGECRSWNGGSAGSGEGGSSSTVKALLREAGLVDESRPVSKAGPDEGESTLGGEGLGGDAGASQVQQSLRDDKQLEDDGAKHKDERASDVDEDEVENEVEHAEDESDGQAGGGGQQQQEQQERRQLRRRTAGSQAY